MNGITLSGLWRHAIAVCLVLLPSLSQATDTHPAAAVKEAKPRITPFRPNPVPAATQTGQGIIHGQPTGDELTPPWIARITANIAGAKRYCTGEFLNEKWVLTARHCTVDSDGEQYPAEDITVDGGSVRIIAAKKIYFMKENTGKEADADVALLELAEDYPFPPDWDFKGVSLYHGNGYMTHKNVRVMGFGRTETGTLASELKYADMNNDRQAQAAEDNYGAPALRLIRDGEEGGYATGGDSGGPALLWLFNNQTENPVPRLVGVNSMGGNGWNDYTRLSPVVLEWIGITTGSAIISSPSDEQVFDTVTTGTISVSWYNNASSVRVELTGRGGGAKNDPIKCQQYGTSSCSLNVGGLAEGNYDIRAVSNGKVVDTVAVRFEPGGKSLDIVYPPKPVKNEDGTTQPLYTYKPDFDHGQKWYTVSGYATAGYTLKAQLIRENASWWESGKNSNPCLDDKKNAMATITANEQGIWVCDIAVRQGDNPENYRFEIQMLGGACLSCLKKPREVDSVNFILDGRKDNGSYIRAKIDMSDYAAYLAKTDTMHITTDIPSDSKAISTPSFVGEFSDNDLRRANTDKSMDVKINMYRSIEKLKDIPVGLIEPEAFYQNEINFVKVGFLRPKQTNVDSKASLITTFGIIDYNLRAEILLPKNGRKVTHDILAMDDARKYYTICEADNSDEGWECDSEIKLEPGFYTFLDAVEYSDGEYVIPQKIRVLIIPSPDFIYPKQTVNLENIHTFSSFNEKHLTGEIDRELLNEIKKVYPSFNSDNAGVLTICRYTDDKKECKPVPIDDGTPQTKVKILDRLGGDKPVSWMTIKGITLSDPGLYLATVTFNARSEDAIKGKTLLKLVAPGVDVTDPPDGSVVNKDIATTPAGTGDAGSKIEATVSSSSTANAGQSRAALSDCTTIVDGQGHWQCEPVALEGDGVYTVSAREYDDSGKQIAKATSTFTVNREDVEKNDDGCQTGYAKGDDGDCHGPGKDAGHAKDGHGFGKSIGIGKFLKGMFDSKAFRCAAAMAATDGEAAKWCLGKNLKTGGLPGMPHRRSCPPGGNLYDRVTKSCRVAPKQNECPSGYFLEGGMCTGPAAGGPDFIISSPANGAVWDCGSTQAGLLTTACYVYGQVAPEDDVVVTLNDPGTGAKLLGLSDYHAVKYDSRHPELWRAGPVSLPKESTLDIQAQRLHNGRPVSGVDALQAIEISTPSDTPYSVLWPAMYEEAKGEAQGVIHGTAPTGTRVQVRSEPAAVSCDVVSTQDSWTCPSRVLTPGSYTLITHWTDKDGKDTGIPGDMRYFSVGPLPAVSITSPSDSDIVKNTYAITGTGYPGAKVSVTGMPSGDECTDRPVATDGKWACDAGYPVVDGEWSLKAQQTFTNGLSNTAEQPYRMADQHREVLTFTSPAQDAVLTTGTYKIAGTGYLDDVVTVTGMPAGSPACEKVSVDENGHWACPEDYPLVDGHYRLKAVSESNDDEYPEPPLTAWRDFSILTPPGAVADITEKKELGSCGFATHITYNCTTVLHLSDRAGKSVPGQSVTLSMSGLLHLKNSSPAVTDDKGDITVASAGSRDMEGQSPSGQLTATSGDVTRDFQVH